VAPSSSARACWATARISEGPSESKVVVAPTVVAALRGVRVVSVAAGDALTHPRPHGGGACLEPLDFREQEQAQIVVVARRAQRCGTPRAAGHVGVRSEAHTGHGGGRGEQCALVPGEGGPARLRGTNIGED